MILRQRLLRRFAVVASCAFLVANSTSCFSESGSQIVDPGTDEQCDVPVSALVGSKKAVITLFGYAFYPDTLRISAGTEVTWVNCDSRAGIDAHTSTSDTNTGTGAWSSPLFADGQIYTRTFGTTGSFGYHCSPHPAMRGVVIVQ